MSTRNAQPPITSLAATDIAAAHPLLTSLIDYLYPDAPLARAGYTSWFGAADIARRLDSPDWLHLAAKDGSRVTGIAVTSIDAGIGTILWLYVDPESRRRGVGGALVRETCATLAGRGCHKSDVLTRTSFPHLREFYQGLGFELAATFPKYRYGIDTLYFIRNLEPLRNAEPLPRAANAPV